MIRAYSLRPDRSWGLFPATSGAPFGRQTHFPHRLFCRLPRCRQSTMPLHRLLPPPCRLILSPASNRSGLVRVQNGNPAVLPSRVYCQKCPFSHGRIRNILFQTEAGVYIKKLLPGTLSGVPGSRKTDFFPQIRVYTEKLPLHIPFFAIGGVLKHNFSLYTLFPRINCAKRGEPARQRGTVEQLFLLYPAGFGQLPSAGSRFTATDSGSDFSNTLQPKWLFSLFVICKATGLQAAYPPVTHDSALQILQVLLYSISII